MTFAVAVGVFVVPHAAASPVGAPRSDGDTQQSDATPPVANPDHYVIDQDSTLVVPSTGLSKLTANDTVAGGDTPVAQRTGGTGPSHGVLVSFDADGSFSYRPETGFVGTDTFTYSVSSGTESSPATDVTIEVRARNQRPVAAPDGYRTLVGRGLAVRGSGVLANDTDPEGDALTADLVSGPRHGTLTLDTHGRFDYRPAPGYVGTDSFRYRARDGASASTTVTDHIDVVAAVKAHLQSGPGTVVPRGRVGGSLSDSRVRHGSRRDARGVTRQIGGISDGPRKASDRRPDLIEGRTAFAPLSGSASLALSTPFANPGGALTATGRGCPARSSVALSVDGSRAGRGVARDDGTFRVTVSTPLLPVGTHTVIARCAGRVLTAPLALTSVTSENPAPVARVLMIAALLGFFLLVLRLAVRRRSSA